MVRKIIHQNNIAWRCLWVILFILGGVCKVSATSIGDVLSGSSVYTDSKGTTSLNKAYLTFTVLSVATSKYSAGTVKVAATANSTITGALTLPSVIYVKSGTSVYPYHITEIPASAFKDQTGITDLYFDVDELNGYDLATIGTDAFAGTTGLTGTIQLPRTITEIGDNAFALSSGSTGTIENVVMGANNQDNTTTLTLKKTIFANRKITNLYVLGNFAAYATAEDQTFNEDNVTNVYYFGDGTTSTNKGDGDKGYYKFLINTASMNSNFGHLSKNIYLPADDVKNFVDQCTNNNHTDWIPSTVNCITFEKTTTDGSTYTLMLKSSDEDYELALHGAKLSSSVTDLNLNFNSWDVDIFPTTTNQNGHVVQIDSKAFDGNDNLQSITITPYSNIACQIQGNAFLGLKSLRYIDLSKKAKSTSKGFTFASGYTLSRVPTTDYDTSVAYKYTKSTGIYDYELSTTTPFGGMPPYTLVFLPTSITSYPSTTSSTETVYKYDGTTATSWARPADENYMLYNSTNSYWQCNNFGVYDVPELNPTTVSGQNYTWYSFSTPYDIHVKTKSTFYRTFTAGVTSSVCLPFAPDKPSSATFYTYKTNDNTSVTLTSVDAPAANTPYFIKPTAETQLASTKSQTILSTATISNTTYMHGVYTGQSMENVSNAYGMAAKPFTSNGTTYPAGTFVKLKQSVKTYINPFRAYLTLGSSSAKASIMKLVFNETPTAIEHTTIQDNNNTPYYNLQGMKTTPSTRGIYIHNGRKVLIK